MVSGRSANRRCSRVRLVLGTFRTVIHQDCTIGQREPALLERLHVEISNFHRASVILFAFTHATEAEVPNCSVLRPVEATDPSLSRFLATSRLQIELLDAAGKTLKREAGFFWMRRGEQRGCVGCHAGPETAPENAVPMTLLKSTTPADLTGSALSPLPEDTQ